jgi:hypothetical protein
MRVGKITRLCHGACVVREMHYSRSKTPGRRCEQAAYESCANGETSEIVTNVLFRPIARTGKLVTAGEATRLSLKTDMTRNKL